MFLTCGLQLRSGNSLAKQPMSALSGAPIDEYKGLAEVFRSMIGSYPPAVRRRLLSKHFLISGMPEWALDNLVKFSTVVRFERHQDIVRKGDPGDCLYGILSGRGADLLQLTRGQRGHAQRAGIR